MEETKSLYLAGGCFWGLEAYFKQIPGIKEVSVGYANGQTDQTYYQIVSQTDHAETVKVVYQTEQLTLSDLLSYFFRVIDPLSVNKQGNDYGRQYRTGIYYTDPTDLPQIQAFMRQQQSHYAQPLAVEVQPLRHYILAEDYHQDYLSKHPQGYCHIDLSQARQPL